MKLLAGEAVLIVLSALIGYGVGVYQWRGMAVVESYSMGFDHGYASGISDASVPGSQVIIARPDGSSETRKIPK